MTVRKHFKQNVRERMHKTGESYTSARRQILKQSSENSIPRDLSGRIPAVTALRNLLTSAGVVDAGTGQPFTEAMLFGIAGGVGIGVAAFRYEKADFSSLFLAGRHLWFDDLQYLKQALARLGMVPRVQESASAKTAEKQLRDCLADGPCIAWVDMAHLPHRALPAAFSGGGYHVVTIERIDDQAKTAWIGDLAREPISIPLADLAVARGRIKKQAHRLLSIPEDSAKLNVADLIRSGLRACHLAMTAKPGKGPLAMSCLESLQRMGERLAGDASKEGWEKMFRPGVNLWRALTSLHQFIEHYGTGGGLCRPMMAEFLTDAGRRLGDNRFADLAARYAELGKAWTSLADAALHQGVPMFREAKKQQVRYVKLMAEGGSVDAKRECWTKLGELEAQAKDCFPLSDAQSADLRAELQQIVRSIIAMESTALNDMAQLVK